MKEAESRAEADARLAELTLLVLYLGSWEEKGAEGHRRAWKGMLFEVLDTLEQQGFLGGSRGAKSVWLTPEGIRRAQDLEKKYLPRR